MFTEETRKTDKEGYLLLPETFEDKKFVFKLFKKLGNGWFIYIKNKDSGKFISWELVKPYKQEEFVIGDATIPKKWAYPSSEKWGLNGFTLLDEKGCLDKFETLNKEESSMKRGRPKKS